MSESAQELNGIGEGVFKAGELSVVDFQDVVKVFDPESGVDEIDNIENLSDEELAEVAETEEVSAKFEDEVDEFLEESERAGKVNPVLYVPDQHYDNLPEDSGEKVDVGAINGSIPVKLLPMKNDLMHMLNRFSFGEDMQQILEGDKTTALLVNPTGSGMYDGTAYVEVGEDVAQEAYETALEEHVDHAMEYLEGQRGIGVAEMSEGDRIEIQVDENRLGGREFDYEITDDELVLEIGDYTVGVGYDGEVHEGELDLEIPGVHEPRVDDEATVYKFVVER